MIMFGYLLLVLLAAIPFLGGLCIVRFLSGTVRFVVGAVVLGTFGMVILFALSPLPQILGVTHDPGYDSQSWVPEALVAAEFAAGLAILGMTTGVLGLPAARRRK